MTLEILIGIIGLISGIIIAVVTIFYSNKNNQKQIIVSKLEELLQLVQSTHRASYRKLKQLEINVIDLRSNQFETLKTLNDYYSLRDQILPQESRTYLAEQLSRLEVLSECYTKSSLRTKLLEYEELMFTFLSFVSVGGNIHKEIYFKDGFPNEEEINKLVKDLKSKIVKEISK